MNRECAGTRVVGDSSQTASVVAVVGIFHTDDLRSGFDDREQTIDVKVGRNSLQHTCGSFQPHARVDILTWQRFQVVRRTADAIELCKDKVPDFDIAAVVQVVIDFATRTTDSIGPLAWRRRRPKVLVFVHPRDSFVRHSDLFFPDSVRIIVVFVDGDGQFLRCNAKPFFVGQKFPGPSNRFFFEIIAKAKVAQHFKERVVKRCSTDVVDVTGAQTFLASRRASEIQLYLAQKVILELVHSGGSEQNGGIPSGNQDIAWFADASFGFKEGEVFFA